MIRFADTADSAVMAKWLCETPNNMFCDPAVFTYPTCNTIVAEDESGPLRMVPIHAAFIMESLANRPDLTPLQQARSLRQIQDGIDNLGRALGIRECYWLCRDPQLIKFAQKHGYELINMPVLGKKL